MISFRGKESCIFVQEIDKKMKYFFQICSTQAGSQYQPESTWPELELIFVNDYLLHKSNLSKWFDQPLFRFPLALEV